MTLVLAVRHGLTPVTGKVLAGWQPGICLDDRGRAQASELGERLAGARIDAIVSSPLERCQQTAELIAAARPGPPIAVQTEDRLGECRYGDWTGRPLRKLAREPLWRIIQIHPSAARFPGSDGESIAQMQCRAVEAVRDWNARLGPEAVYLICSHADVIKSILADSLGLHLDLMQRVVVDPCSLSVIRYTPLRPFLVRMNDSGADIARLSRPHNKAPRAALREGDAPVGGGAGG